MEAIEWLVQNTATGNVSVDEAKLADFEAKKAELVQKLNDYSIMVQSKQGAINAKWSDMAALSSSIGTQSTISGQNLKTVNGLLLQRYAVGFSGFSEADVSVLTEIAQQCVGRGGEGVYIARSLLIEQTKEAVEYNDECIQALDSRESDGKNEAATAASKLQVMPNPANDRTNVVLPSGHDISSLTLLDAYGRVVQVFEITPGQKTMDINTAGLQPGVYFLAPSNREDSPVRFTVLH